MNKNAMKSTTNYKEDWCTPPWLFGRLQEVFNFEVDGAANSSNNLLPSFHTKNTDASLKAIDYTIRRIFVNPPFNGLHNFTVFFSKWNNLTCFLLPFRPETQFWHKKIWPYGTVFVFNKRIQYIHPETKQEVKGAAFPSCLVFFGSLQRYDLTKLSDLGIFVKKTC